MIAALAGCLGRIATRPCTDESLMYRQPGASGAKYAGPQVAKSWSPGGS
jgi:hypothetical protein